MAASSRTSRVLPMPGSPEIKKRRKRPEAVSVSPARNSVILLSRPINAARDKGSRHHPPAVQGLASAERGRAMYPTRRAGGARTAHPSRLSRSATAGGTRGARTAADRAADPRGASAADEDAGGVRLRQVPPGLRATDPRTGQGRLHRQGRANHLYRRQRDRQNPSAHRAGGGGLPAQTAGPI